MTTRLVLFAAVLALLIAGAAVAQFPVLDMVAEKVVEKYRSDLRAALGGPRQAEVRSARRR